MLLNFRESAVYYKIEGKGPALVLLHGFLENATIWDFLISEFSDRYTILAIDLPGHGKSDCRGYIHTMEEMAETVNAVLLHEKIAEATFIGHSMGGYVTLAFLEKYKTKVGKLVLLNSTPEEDSEERKRNRERAIELVKKNRKAFLSMALTNLFAELNREKFKEEIDRIKEEAMDMSVQGIVASLEGLKIRKDRTRLLKSFARDKYIIAGKQDPIMDANELESLAVECRCKFLVLSGGHMSTIENKEEMLNFMHFIE